MINSSRFALKLLLLLLVLVLFQVNRFSAKFAIANDRVAHTHRTHVTEAADRTAATSPTQTVSQDGLWLQLDCTV